MKEKSASNKKVRTPSKKAIERVRLFEVHQEFAEALNCLRNTTLTPENTESIKTRVRSAIQALAEQMIAAGVTTFLLGVEKEG